MQDFIKKIRTEHFYNNQLEVYERIKHNEKAVFEWIIDLENMVENLPPADARILLLPYLYCKKLL